MGALMRCHDWHATPLGAPATWPQSLRSAVSIMLNSRYPIALYWGHELALLYNDAWSPIPGNKHPWALGRPGREVWPEIWDTIGPLYEKVIASGEGVWQQDELLPMLRHGYVEECYFNFTFSPIRGEDGGIDGIFNAVVETTERVLGERRLRTLSKMGQRADSGLSVEGASKRAIDILAENRADVPFALVYLREDNVARLVAFASVDKGSVAATVELALTENAPGPWPLAAAEQAGKAIVTAPSPALELANTFWSEPLTEVVVVPIASVGEPRPVAFLVAGANPRRRVDENYRSFFELAAGHIGTAIGTARSYESERRKAEALAEIDRAKTTFFSNVSHEFRTPLTLMLGPLEDALASATAPDERARLDVAHRNALRLLRLVNSLLDFSRIEAGRVDAIFIPTDLAALTADLASSFRSAMDKAGLRFFVEISPLSHPAYVDRDMWEKVVLNLLSNAFKFTHQGEVAVGLREVHGQAVLTVRDTGDGIPAGELPKLFDRFHRVEGAKGRSFEGSGIGLALVQELVKLHGGIVTVESEEGRGTVFTITLPLGAAHLPANRIRGASDDGAPWVGTSGIVEEALQWLPTEPGSSSFDDSGARDVVPEGGGLAVKKVGRGHVLLADDNADLRQYISRLLSESGYDVVTTPDGEAAFAALRIKRPDIIVTDVMMPRMDGFGLLRAVREDEVLRDLPVILLSARAGEESKLDGLRAGADDYLTKPFSARELIAKVSANIVLARVRREAVEAVKSSEERFRQLAETINQVFYITDVAEKRLLYLSPAYERVWGRPAADLMADLSRFLDTIHPDDRDRVAAAGPRQARGEPLDLEYRIIRPDGSVRVIHDRAFPVEGSGMARSVGLAEDVTLQRAADERLRELNATLEQRVADALAEKRLLADIVQATDASVQVLDNEFRVLAINGAAVQDYVRIFGLRPAVGQSLLEVLAVFPGEREAARQVWGRVLGGEAFTETSWWGDDARERRAYETQFRPLFDPGGRQIGAYLFGRDVTDRIREQERLTAAEEQLRQAQKMEAMGQLTGGVAHDFNNLLTPIVGALDMLQRKGVGGDREQRLISGAAQSADRAKTLVQRLLAFARRQPLQATGVDVAILISGMADLIRSTTGPQIRVAVEVSEDLPSAKADPNQLEMALLNLAVNARDAMPDGGTLRITASEEQVESGHRSSLAAGRFIRLSVADTGVGMDETVLARAVEPFYSTKGIGKGTGLGLSMVHGLVSQLGGAITIQSQLGMGTNVELWLPISTEPAANGESPTIKQATLSGAGTVLLVDDEDLARASTADMLLDLGYTVIEAGSAEEALRRIRNGLTPSLLVTDHLMPGMNGTDLARIVRSEMPAVKVLLVSGYADADGVAADLARLIKPFRNDELAASLESLHSTAGI